MYQPPLDDIRSDGGLSEITLLSAIVNSSDDAIVGKTSDGMITSWNPGAARMYGYSAGEIIGQPMTTLCPPDRVGEIDEILGTIRRGERVVHFETERRRKDGTIFPASVTVSPIHDKHGRLVGASSIARDITEQRQLRAMSEFHRRAAELGRANQNLETFTHSVSHDLGAPLRAMSGYSDALLDEYGDVLGDVGRGYAERIQAAGEQMASLIEDLLKLSRILRAEMHLATVDLGAEAARIAGELQRSGPDRSVNFVIQRPVQARADHALIRTVLANLLENAWKFTSRQDEASIEFGTMPAQDVGVSCYVRDNGAGFDPAYADRLFQPFRRLHAADEFPGTGIGLAAVREIVQRHGGDAWAEGVVGEGATFHFTLNAKEMP
ncbi:MAG TPA: PAS domain S-box protein [Streptosporangiaceae bacterium]|nr:PAS domain S-box protein [Streptosporangiaceae bacterium]